MHRKFLLNSFLLAFGAVIVPNSMTLAAELETRSELSIDSSTAFMRVNFITESSIQYSANVSYSYSLSPEFQLGLQTSVYNSGAQIDPFRFSFLIPFTYNWGAETLANKFFFRVSPGISYNQALDGALFLQLGKRFQVLGPVSLRPTIGTSLYFFNGFVRTAVDIVPLAFSITF